MSKLSSILLFEAVPFDAEEYISSLQDIRGLHRQSVHPWHRCLISSVEFIPVLSNQIMSNSCFLLFACILASIQIPDWSMSLRHEPPRYRSRSRDSVESSGRFVRLSVPTNIKRGILNGFVYTSHQHGSSSSLSGENLTSMLGKRGSKEREKVTNLT